MRVKITEEQQKLIDIATEFIVKRKLTIPSIFFFETTKPLASIGSQLLQIIEPFATFIFPREHYNSFIEIIKQPDGIEYFLQSLEKENEKFTEKEKINNDFINNYNKMIKISYNEKKAFIDKMKDRKKSQGGNK